MKKTTDYIFSINTGRCGSHYLSNIFKHVFSCQSFHELQPIGNKQAMRLFSQGHLEPMRNITEKKVKVIKDLKRDHSVYFESNHCFIKGFGWFVPEYIPQDRIGVIILKRDKIKVAESYLRIDSSPLTSLGRRWVSAPNMKNPLVKPPTTAFTYELARIVKYMLANTRHISKRFFQRDYQYPKWLSNYELECLKWYVEETYAKAEVFKQQYPAIKYYEVNTEDLNSLETVQHMLEYFGCDAKKSLNQVVGIPTNLRLF